jgi:hypothetical protein
VKFIDRFFPYAGAKHRFSIRYPRPRFEKLIEPFAGSAGYATRFPMLKVELYDLDPIICGVWDYLIKVTEKEFLKLPTPDGMFWIDDLPVCQEAKWLIGFWCNLSTNRPVQRPHKMMLSKQYRWRTSFWGTYVKEKLVQQLDWIRHWKVFNKDFCNVANETATWFIDPPYQYRQIYRLHSIDFAALAKWVRSRRGQIIACEAGGADWLPFKHFESPKSRMRKYEDYSEVLYYRLNEKPEIKI